MAPLPVSDTIVALASSAGLGGVGVVRLSGPEALEVARRLAPWFPQRPTARLLCFGGLVGAAGERLDHGFVVWFPEGRSYTGEASVELQVHGGGVNLARVLRAAVAAGARLALPGEFTRRAFLNGRVDLAQAEAVAELVAARSEAGLDLAQAQLAGGLSGRIRAARDALLDVLAQLEVQLDFVDEDLGDALTRSLEAPLREVRDVVARLRASYAVGRVWAGHARVVLAGAPNAGKSSLFNALVGAERAIVTPAAGTTRDWLEATVDVGGVVVALVDTAGLRDAPDPVEAIGVARSREVAAGADLVVWLEAPDAPGEAAPDGALCVATKRDLAVGPGRPGAALSVSAVTGEGLDALRAAIRERLVGAPPASEDVVTNPRHYAALTAAEAALDASLAMAPGAPELVAVDVHEALHQLGLVVGATATEDLLDRIFARFCIGK